MSRPLDHDPIEITPRRITDAADPIDLTMTIYMDDSTMYEYPVPGGDSTKAREHAHVIMERGLTIGPKGGALIFIPPHRIHKIVARGNFQDQNPKYSGKFSGA